MTAAPSRDRRSVALVEAKRMRHLWMLALAEGTATPLALFQAAAPAKGKPLRRIHLDQILLTCTNISAKKAKTLIDRLRRLCQTTTTTERPLTVGWLLDARSDGRRLDNWIDLFEMDRTGGPWPGYPWAKPPVPEGGQ